jgi:hypothetical protein
MDTVRRVGHKVSLYLVAAALFAVSLLGIPQASLAGFGNPVGTYDVSFQNLSAANGSYLLWLLNFGSTPSAFPSVGNGLSLVLDFQSPTFPCAFFAPTGCVDIIPGLLDPGTGAVLPTLDTVFFTPGGGTGDIALTNFDVRGPTSDVLSFSAVSLAFRSFSFPGDFQETFTFTDPPGGTLPVPFTFTADSVDPTGTATTLAAFSILFNPDGTSEVLSSQGVQITRTFGSSPPGLVPPPSPVPEPGTALLLGAGLAGLAAATWRGKRR